MPQFPNEYVDAITFTSTGGDVGFGFIADAFRMRNRSTKSVYLKFGSTTGATTSGLELGASEELILQFGSIGSGFSFAATSSGTYLTVGAWGV